MDDYLFIYFVFFAHLDVEMWVTDFKVNAVKASPVCVFPRLELSKKKFWLLESDEDRRELESR